MVNAESIEIVVHLCKALLPPCKAILAHGRPVIGGEAPVLPFYGEGIRRRARLQRHVEQVRLLPGICTVPANADGYIALDNDVVFMRISRSRLQLYMQMILDEKMNGNFVGRCFICQQFVYFFVLILFMSAPKTEISSVVFIS